MRYSFRLAMLAFIVLASPVQAGGRARGVVELFTSQGCNSCPPADRALGVLANRGGIITLAWHVDYWDYLGWKDTFSSRAFTQRQRAYNASLGAGVFTPQIIVNGSRVTSTGNMGGAASGGLPVSVDVKRVGGKTIVTVGGGSGSANLYLVSYTNSSTVAIKRGENSGKLITYRHAVRGIRNIGKWNGKAASFEVAAGGSCAILLQRGGAGTILGAAMC